LHWSKSAVGTVDLTGRKRGPASLSPGYGPVPNYSISCRHIRIWTTFIILILLLLSLILVVVSDAEKCWPPLIILFFNVRVCGCAVHTRGSVIAEGSYVMAYYTRVGQTYPFEIFAFTKYRELETRVRVIQGHWKWFHL